MTARRESWHHMGESEKRALIDTMDAQAEAFLQACFHLARFMQLEVEQGLAIDLLKVQEQNMLRLYQYYQENIDPISGKLREELTPRPHPGGIGI